ncbi:MAG: AsmA family protein, partial [gamma proteobacterium symbiont of Taylorina sp.]|nr:AsmA family protein [gamma proteobacterium symbiont of Taylorina sp.]
FMFDKSLVGKLFKFFAIILIIIFISSVLITTLIDINQYKNEISQWVKEETGLSLEINGELYLGILSGIKFKADDITISYHNNTIAQIDSIALGTTLTSLYRNKPEITSLSINIQKLNLIRDKKKQYNFLVPLNNNLNEIEAKNNSSSIDKFFLNELSIKNIDLSIESFQFQDKLNSLSIKLESLQTSLSILPIIDHHELVIDDPRILVDYSYAGELTLKKAWFNRYQLADLSLSFNEKKGIFTAEELVFHLSQTESDQVINKLDLSSKGKLTLAVSHHLPKDRSEPVWSQLDLIKLQKFDFNVSDFKLSHKEFQVDIKKSHLLLGEHLLFENKQFSWHELKLKSLDFSSDGIDFTHQVKNKYHFGQSVLHLENIPIMYQSKALDPLSSIFLKKMAKNSLLQLTIDRLENNKQGIKNIKVTLRGKDKKINLSNLSFNAVDSKIIANGELSLQKKIPQWAFNVDSEQLNLKPITSLLGLESDVEGYISIKNNFAGSLENSDFKVNQGRVYAKGRNISISGFDINKVLNDFESSQSVGLLDVGAVVLLGPAGIALTKGKDYTALASSLGHKGKSQIRQLTSDISFSKDVASMDDVSFTTDNHHLVIKGQINLRDETFMQFQVATVDQYGCPIYKESVTGSLHSPTTKKVNILVKGIVNPIKSVTSKLTSKIIPKCEEPFYNGSLKLD